VLSRCREASVQGLATGNVILQVDDDSLVHQMDVRPHVLSSMRSSTWVLGKKDLGWVGVDAEGLRRSVPD
jgi:hypothetical protein